MTSLRFALASSAGRRARNFWGLTDATRPILPRPACRFSFVSHECGSEGALCGVLIVLSTEEPDSNHGRPPAARYGFDMIGLELLAR